MSRHSLTVFLCTGKDCSKAWRHVCDGSPRKWLKRHFRDACVPVELQICETECMDRCKDAACVWLIHDGRARLESEVCSASDLGRLLGAGLDLLDVGWHLGGTPDK